MNNSGIRDSHTAGGEDILGFILQPGGDDTILQVITQSGAALSKPSERQREFANHRVWEISELGPCGPEAMDVLVRAVNRYIREEELGSPIPEDHRGWDEERTLQFLDMARDELRWRSSTVEPPAPWGGHQEIWREIQQDYPLVFQKP